MLERTSPSTRMQRSQEGLALPTVLFLGVVLFLLVTAVAFRGLVGLNQSDRERQRGETLHIADGGVDKALYELVEDKGFTTQSGSTPDTAGPVVGADEKQWALDKAALKGAPTTAADPMIANLVKPNRGEWAIIKPQNQAVVYAVGWVPNRATA